MCDKLVKVRKEINPYQFNDDCRELILAIKRAANHWADRHPMLYFNWTARESAQAELVIESDWDSLKKENDSLAITICFKNKVMKKMAMTNGNSVQNGVTCCRWRLNAKAQGHAQTHEPSAFQDRDNFLRR